MIILTQIPSSVLSYSFFSVCVDFGGMLETHSTAPTKHRPCQKDAYLALAQQSLVTGNPSPETAHSPVT